MSKQADLEKRLSSYWKMEIANAPLLPVAMIYLAMLFDSSVGVLSLITFVPMVCLLVIGGLYWRAKLLRMKGQPHALGFTMRLAHLAQIPMLLLTSISSGLVALHWANPSLSAGLGDRIVATVATLLAALEYVNYYHRQLQHLDHKDDLKRFLSGQGFRPSQMNGDLKKWRRRWQ